MSYINAEGVAVQWPEEYEGSLADWARDAPDKTVLNILGRADLTDEEFTPLKGVGLKYLNMEECTGITDAAFANLEGLHTLLMSNCNQEAITDAAFVHLKGIKRLDMDGCTQDGITDAAFANLVGIEELNMSSCNQEAITNTGIAYLKGIKRLRMGSCTQSGITNEAIANLRGIELLNIAFCTQFTDAAIEKLEGIKDLYIAGCTNPGMTYKAFDRIGPSIKNLGISYCTQLNVTETLKRAKNVEMLHARSCTQGGFNDDSLLGLDKLGILDISECTQDWLTPEVFREVRLFDLTMDHCRQDSFDEISFRYLESLNRLSIYGCKPIVYKGIAQRTWSSLNLLSVGTNKQAEKPEICGYLATITRNRPTIKIRGYDRLCEEANAAATARAFVESAATAEAAAPAAPAPTVRNQALGRYTPANDSTPKLADRAEVQQLKRVFFAIPEPPLPEHEMPSMISDAIHGDMPLGEYMIKMSGDCLIFKIGEKYAGVQKSYLLKEMFEGSSTFYECTKRFLGDFRPYEIYSVPYFGVRTSLGSFYVPYDQMRVLLMSAWSFWELTKAGTLQFTASRDGVLVGGPIVSADHCQDGTTKTVHDSQAITFKTEEEEEEEVPNIITLKYGETKKEIPYDEAMTVGAIRDKAKELFSIPDVKLVYTGRILDDDAKTVKSATIQKGYTIQVLKVGGNRKTKRGRGKKTYRRKV